MPTRSPFGTTRTTRAWYIDERDSTGNVRARWPTLTRADSGPER